MVIRPYDGPVLPLGSCVMAVLWFSRFLSPSTFIIIIGPLRCWLTWSYLLIVSVAGDFAKLHEEKMMSSVNYLERSKTECDFSLMQELVITLVYLIWEAAIMLWSMFEICIQKKKCLCFMVSLDFSKKTKKNIQNATTYSKAHVTRPTLHLDVTFRNSALWKCHSFNFEEIPVCPRSSKVFCRNFYFKGSQVSRLPQQLQHTSNVRLGCRDFRASMNYSAVAGFSQM